MPAYVILRNKPNHSLTLPADAVIRNANSNVVWLQIGHNTYKNTIVETGLEDGDRVEIKSGLKPGDIVVTSGAYLVNSEYVFKHDAVPIAGMKMK